MSSIETLTMSTETETITDTNTVVVTLQESVGDFMSDPDLFLEAMTLWTEKQHKDLCKLRNKRVSAAGTRFRKGCMDAKKMCDLIRKEIQADVVSIKEERKSKRSEASASPPAAAESVAAPSRKNKNKNKNKKGKKKK